MQRESLAADIALHNKLIWFNFRALIHADETIHRTHLTVHPGKGNRRLNLLTISDQDFGFAPGNGFSRVVAGGWGAPRKRITRRCGDERSDGLEAGMR